MAYLDPTPQFRMMTELPLQRRLHLGDQFGKELIPPFKRLLHLRQIRFARSRPGRKIIGTLQDEIIRLAGIQGVENAVFVGPKPQGDLGRAAQLVHARVVQGLKLFSGKGDAVDGITDFGGRGGFAEELVADRGP
jgi:hypothetical protein